MNFAPPKPDRTVYESRIRELDAAWARSLTAAERLYLYAELFDLVWMARDDREYWCRATLNDKLATRRRMVDAFLRIDRLK